MKKLQLLTFFIACTFLTFAQSPTLPEDIKEVEIIFVEYHMATMPPDLKGMGKKIQQKFTTKHNKTAEKWNEELIESAKEFSSKSTVVKRNDKGEIIYPEDGEAKYLIYFKLGKMIETSSYGGGMPAQHVSSELFFTYYIQNIETKETTDLFEIKGLDDPTLGAKPKSFFKELDLLIK